MDIIKKVIGQKVAIIQDDPPKQIGSIIVNQATTAKPNTGKVFMVGQNTAFVEIGVSVGERIAFNPAHAQAAEVNGVEFLIVNYEGIKYVLNDD